MQRAFHSTRRAVALALIAGHLCTLAFAASSSFHQWLHGDADAAHHECAVVTLLAGTIVHPDPPSRFIPPAVREVAPAFAAFRACEGEPSEALAPSRAPPVG